MQGDLHMFATFLNQCVAFDLLQSSWYALSLMMKDNIVNNCGKFMSYLFRTLGTIGFIPGVRILCTCLVCVLNAESDLNPLPQVLH